MKYNRFLIRTAIKQYMDTHWRTGSRGLTIRCKVADARSQVQTPGMLPG
jgi:hypothetical protein